jgi:hypothetical protein
MNIAEELESLGVTVVRKDKSRLMRALGWLFKRTTGYDFMGRAWTTISFRTIYAPTHVDLDNLDAYESPIRHELVHVQQIFNWWVLFHIAYLLLPVPVLFAWGRWYFERSAYLVQIREFGRDPDEVVETLWRVYLWPWPRPWMRAWFAKQLGKR